MPPRYAYWTILIDNKPTAFRARDKEELLPTLQQLRRTNKDVVMKWFAQGRLWESPEEQRETWRQRRAPSGGGAPRDREKEKRGRDWRPGGQHRDPRDRFKKKSQPSGPTRRPGPSKHGGQPWRERPRGTDRNTLRARTHERRPPDFTPERRESDTPPKPGTDPKPAPPARPAQKEPKPEPPERG